MCISFAVGQNCPNSTNDVRTIQIALNLAKSKTHENTMKGFNLGNGGTVAEQVLHSMSPDLVTDGKYGNKTLKAIQNFQKNIVGMKQPDGKIEPGKGTIKALQACMSTTLNAEKLQAIYIHAPRSRIDKFFPHLTPMMTASKINTPLRIAHFLAQIGHESGELRYTEELASGKAYEGRKDLGNTIAGDGEKFKGRGLIQITGRANYKKYGDDRSADYVTGDAGKQIASNPRLAVDVACWYWDLRNLNAYADSDNTLKITRLINGGTNGLNDRQAKLARAKFFFNI